MTIVACKRFVRSCELVRFQGIAHCLMREFAARQNGERSRWPTVFRVALMAGELRVVLQHAPVHGG